MSSLAAVSNAARHGHEGPKGLGLLPRDLSDGELDAAPVLESLDALVIEELTDDEAEAFAAVLES
jgi:hypothetical protein